MKRIILLTLALIAGRVFFAQDQQNINDERPVNSISLNLIGDASFISINYERLFILSPILMLSSKLGVGYNEEFQLCFGGSCPSPERYLTIPHHLTLNIGKSRHFLELGLGGTVINGNTTQPYILYPIVGYRNMLLICNKLNFRIFGQMPFSGLGTDDILFIPLGLSLGVTF